MLFDDLDLRYCRTARPTYGGYRDGGLCTILAHIPFLRLCRSRSHRREYISYHFALFLFVCIHTSMPRSAEKSSGCSRSLTKRRPRRRLHVRQETHGVFVSVEYPLHFLSDGFDRFLQSQVTHKEPVRIYETLEDSPKGKKKRTNA
ncbi:hypothetical protein DENSPDRAFT_512532 [Dentipellis sp. KUC8613]|nr:hypothetical protein DENSPDRAFT_512532 [Dentipellis sp. KUC8613]